MMVFMLFWWVIVLVMFSGRKMCWCRKVVKFWLDVLLIIRVSKV